MFSGPHYWGGTWKLFWFLIGNLNREVTETGMKGPQIHTVEQVFWLQNQIAWIEEDTVDAKRKFMMGRGNQGLKGDIEP